jgi:hypothetical protein
MLLWKKLVLGIMVFSRYAWLRNQARIGARPIVRKGQNPLEWAITDSAMSSPTSHPWREANHEKNTKKP